MKIPTITIDVDTSKIDAATESLKLLRVEVERLGALGVPMEVIIDGLPGKPSEECPKEPRCFSCGHSPPTVVVDGSNFEPSPYREPPELHGYAIQRGGKFMASGHLPGECWWEDSLAAPHVCIFDTRPEAMSYTETGDVLCSILIDEPLPGVG